MLKTLTNAGIALSVIASSLVSAPAEASYRSREYKFNKNVGSAYIHSIQVNKRSNGTSMSGWATLPTCDRHHYLSGTIKASFYGDNGGYMKNHTLYRAVRARNNEGQKVRIASTSKATMSPKGRVYVTTNLTCAPLTTQRRIENNVNQGVNNVRDQLRHLDPSNLWR